MARNCTPPMEERLGKAEHRRVRIGIRLRIKTHHRMDRRAGGTRRTTDSGATSTIEQASNTDWFCMTFLDADNGWAGGQDQTIDDLPGSIWKRNGSALAALKKT